MKKLPSIYEILEVIDPDQTINRQEAMGEITSIAVAQSVGEFKELTDEPLKGEIESYLSKTEQPSYEELYKKIEEAGKADEYFEVLNRNIESIRIDYIKTHLAALTPEKKEEILTKFPTLREI